MVKLFSKEPAKAGKDDARQISIDFGVRKARLFDAAKEKIFTTAERRIDRLRAIAALMEDCEAELKSTEVNALGSLIRQTAEDINDEVFIHMVEEDELDLAKAR